MKETKKSRIEWLELAGAWEGSGQSQRLFCESHGLKVATFGYWRRQYLGEQSAPSGFVELAPSSGPSQVKLRLGGLEVELSGDAVFVAEVIGNLAGLC
jgi:hypothetical protein